MSQASDGSVAAAMNAMDVMDVARSNSDLQRAAAELDADMAANGAVVVSAADDIAPAAVAVAAADIAPAAVADGGDATGQCDSSNGDSSDNDEGDEQSSEVEEENMEVLMDKGGVMLKRFASMTDSQETDDGFDYEEEEIRKEFATIKTSTWMQKKIDAKHVELSALVAQHEKSKKDLVAPVKEMIKEQPTRKQPLTAFAGLLSDACTDGELRAKIIESAAVLKSQEKIVDNVQKAMQVIQVGQVCLEEKKAVEAKKRGESSSVMGAAASLVSNAKRSAPTRGSASKRRK